MAVDAEAYYAHRSFAEDMWRRSGQCSYECQILHILFQLQVTKATSMRVCKGKTMYKHFPPPIPQKSESVDA
ncbi:hypothetical protein L6452_31818 [Arctium lappa]|uniref:Uncharacterized protein n=1 Tax=Arctium lappa TaxID=4217 RepID=A0ACB8Z3R6_ARCLA|nr:hypothetical protein L6452_31818 [Arctium lappa]